MILNDISNEIELVRFWASELDRKLSDQTGHSMLIYGDELIIERRAKVIFFRIPWQAMANDLFAMAHPDSPWAEPVDGSDFYMESLANMIKSEFAR